MNSVSGERRFAASPEQVFQVLVDPDVMVSALPGARGYRVLDGDHWEAKVKPPVPLAPSVTITIEVVERRPGEHASLRARGGGAHVSSNFDLAGNDAETLMRWDAEVALSGLLGRLAGSSLEAVAERQAKRMLDAVELALTRLPAEAADGAH
ncbi:MAG TPA: SRPBCC family protein [Gaiellaceae bacterium]|jgi:2-furoyl-CoA dehydrogenase large subunit|nr:SRPBCC family protein [Gaiellaceae bacterium]